jgi:FkbM family methyltransferase
VLPSLFSLAVATDGLMPRAWIAAAANMVACLKGGDDGRRFGVDHEGRWVNQQPGVTFVSPDIYTAHYRQVEARVLDSWCHLYTPKEGDTIVDVGAGIGEEAAVFSRLVGPSGRVIAIEAHPRTFACLEGMVARSEMSNVVAVQCAIADQDCVLRISNGALHVANSILDARGGFEITARSLDSLMAELQVTRIDLLKMNIEGAERAAMEGMAAVAPLVGHVAIECHDFVTDAGGGEQFRTMQFVMDAVRNFGFEVHRREAAAPWLRHTVYGRRAAET